MEKAAALLKAPSPTALLAATRTWCARPGVRLPILALVPRPLQASTHSLPSSATSSLHACFPCSLPGCGFVTSQEAVPSGQRETAADRLQGAHQTAIEQQLP